LDLDHDVFGAITGEVGGSLRSAEQLGAEQNCAQHDGKEQPHQYQQPAAAATGLLRSQIRPGPARLADSLGLGAIRLGAIGLVAFVFKHRHSLTGRCRIAA
jgi:hypothetical protein